MAQDFEQLLKDVFGDSIGRLTQFQSDQVQRLMSKAQEIAREAVKDDFTRLNGEIADLRARLTVLEEERAQKAADSLESF